MLDPELLEKLAREPERNAPAVNLALAEEGRGEVLLALARSAAVRGDALAVVARRVESDGEALEAPSDETEAQGGEPLLIELERALVVHPEAPAAVRDAVLARHSDEPFFVLAAAAHAGATPRALERAALWPARYPVLDRPWLGLIPPASLPPLLAEAWAQDDDARLREAVALLGDAPALLETLAVDPRREVRRAVASNPSAAAALRDRLGAEDPAAEVRARARLAPETPPRAVAAVGATLQESPRFALALEAMTARGTLAPDVLAALTAPALLDEEAAFFAGQALPRASLAQLLGALPGAARPEAVTGLAAGIAVRRAQGGGLGREDESDLREVVADAAKALSHAPQAYGALTGKARVAAWLADGIATTRASDAGALTELFAHAPLAAERMVLARACARTPALLGAMCEAAARGEHAPPALLGLGWLAPDVPDAVVEAMARRLGAVRARGRELPEDELDLDPTRRDRSVLERVVLEASRRVTVSPRAALAVVALDARRVRYVLTAMAQWRGRLSGVMLARVLRHHAGALSAGRAESRARGAEVKVWTERIMNDVEVAVALAIGHLTVEELCERVRIGRHRLEDGVSVAFGAEARAAVEGSASLAPLVGWADRHRGREPAALALWLLLEAHDPGLSDVRRGQAQRAPGVVASAVDALAGAAAVVPPVVGEALAELERREPGRLERVVAQSPRGKATLAAAIARAYRALGGLRDER
jgi:hypothetical protein